MAVTEKWKSILVDAGLVAFLVLALVGVYRVESSSPPPPAIVLKDNQKLEVTRTAGLTGDKITYKIYEIRTAPKEVKAELNRQFGGTPETQQAVQNGLDWLARHQSQNGFWSNQCLSSRSNGQGQCEGPTICTMPGVSHPVAQTGLALLALQADGNYECNNNKYSDHVKRGIKWLIDNQDQDGALLASRVGTFMYEHAIGTFALAEACAVRRASGQNDDPTLREAATRAIKFIEDIQHNDGGWRYSTNEAEGSDVSVTGRVMLALKSAREAGIEVKQETIERLKKYFESCETGGMTGYTRGSGPSDSMTAVGMLTHLLLLKEPEHPLVASSSKHLASQADRYGKQVKNGNTEFYTLYNGTLAMYQVGGERWNQWNNAIRDGIVAAQKRGNGCERGSWDSNHTLGGNSGGRIYSTALATLMLEVYYRYSRNDQESKKSGR
jgi:hypothetical protein